jgi:hypothetical protein
MVVVDQVFVAQGDLGLGGERILRHRGDDALQRRRVVGQIVGRDRHAAQWIRSTALWGSETKG